LNSIHKNIQKDKKPPLLKIITYIFY